jgi:hypothetical protein
MKLDLTNFNVVGFEVSEFLAKDTQFSEDITTILSKLSTIEMEYMTPYAEVTSADRSVIDKMLATIQNWRDALNKLYATAIKRVVQSDFSITEGVAKSIDQPYLTYNSTSDEVTINTITYSNDITIGTIPKMEWENGNTVVLENEWYGIGTKRARCKIDSSGHYDEKIKGSVDLHRSNVVEPVKAITKFTVHMSNYSTNQPYVTFDHLTNKLIINMNVLKDTPHVNQIPVLNWIGDTTSDTETVELQTDWVGLGTYAINCIISSDSLGPIADSIEGTIILTYEPGSSEAWSLRYDWDTYDALIVDIKASLNQDIPLTTNTYTTYVENMNASLSDIIALEASIEKDYAIASAQDIQVINHILSTVKNWKFTIKDSITNLNTIFPTIKT